MDNHDDTIVIPELNGLSTGVYQLGPVVNEDGETEERLVRRQEHSQRYANVQPIRLGVRQAG